MYHIGIWERDEGLGTELAARVIPESAQLLLGQHPADFATSALSLLVISPGATGWAGAGAVDCQMVLLPGCAGPLARTLRTGCAVSYGTSPKDTLTFSSLEGDQICLAIQRELVTLEGRVLGQQELVLPFPLGASPLIYLATVGTLLLLGTPPGRLVERWHSASTGR